MKVLYYGMDSCLGGIEAFVKNMYSSFEKDKIRVDFLKMTNEMYYEDKFVKNGSEIHKIPNRKPNPFIFYYSLIKFFEKHKEYTIIHLHLNTCSCIAPAIVAKLFGRKVVVHSHNDFKENQILKRILYYINKVILNRFVDIRLACSISAGKCMFDNKVFKVINNGIDTQKYVYDFKVRARYRRKFGIEDKFVVGHIGRFMHQKNHEYLIEIFKNIYCKNNKAVLLLIGDGSLRPKIEEKVKQEGLSNNVIFTGVREDIPMLLQAMDVFVLPSLFEGLGIVAIEAQASGLPCIVSEKVPQEAFVTDLVEPVSLEENVEIWANSILRYSNGYERKDMTKEIIRSGFDRLASVKELEQIYLMN